MLEDEIPIAWKAVPRHVAVLAADATEIGTAESILGDEEEDIFHGLALRRAGDGETVEVPARRVKKMTEQHIVTDLTADEVRNLPAYRRR